MISITSLDYNEIKPENIFAWLELFAFKRYGENIYTNPKEVDDPRYDVKNDNSPIDWYTYAQLPSQYYGKTVLIIDLEQYEKIKEKFKSLTFGTKVSQASKGVRTT